MYFLADNGLLAVFILGALTGLAQGQSAEFNATVAETFEKFEKDFGYIKACNRFEVLGFCPEKQLTVCVMGHETLRTRKICDYCSVAKTYGFKYGTCPDDKLAKLAEKEGIPYGPHAATPHELKRQLSFLNQYRRMRGESTEGFNINFPTGSEVENPEPVELIVEDYDPPKGNATDLVGLQFVEPIADKKKKAKAKIAREATLDKLKKLLEEIGEIF